ncbi:asparaginase [Metallosphaera yellowstonensis MK1]|jgi:beta-aspartyl-peptidase (threonine type)|uniref:Plant-type L-asparaginase n=1 Tax=Metallosphaera yellowstonensis MK1 TaxID=671065 RepID=H2C376_9CREN|nr:asparaginase [Metallosphaera yellowstonensis MK1]
MLVVKFTVPVLVIHGGAGSWRNSAEDRVRREIGEALDRGYAEFRTGSSLEAVVEAVSYMEDVGIFNAGIGSVKNSEGQVEMDAGVMYGRDMSVGAVASVRAKNPVREALKVLRDGKHALMVRTVWEDLRIEGVEHGSDTVGAVALDAEGGLSAATSTGGIRGKLPGRVGDSPIPGAGFYATSRVAVSCTGVGELILKILPSKEVDMLRGMDFPLEEAVRAVVGKMTSTFGSGNFGIIALDYQGNSSWGFNTEAMPRGVRWNQGKRVMFWEGS